MTSTNLRWVHLLVLLNPWVHWVEFPALAQDHGNQSFTYNGFKSANNLHLEGNAQIHPNGLLQLTNTSDQQIGRAFYQIPISFNRTSLSFSTTFVFSIVPAFPDHGGHGLAFTVSPTLNFNHSAGNQYLGLLNSASNNLTSNHLLAVELDTVQNQDLGDINKNHVGIDVNSLNSTASAPVTYSDSKGRNKSLELVSGKAIQVWVDYEYEEEEGKNLLNVTIAPIKSPKPDQPLLSIPINLSSIFLDFMYAGFSSAAGIVASNHYILGWSFNRSGLAQGLEHSKLPSFPHQRRSGQKPGPEYTVPLATAFILLIITILGIVYYVRRKKYEEIHEDWEKEYGPQRFSYKDLYKATKGFKDRELLGSGGFGKVYRGVDIDTKVVENVGNSSSYKEEHSPEEAQPIIATPRGADQDKHGNDNIDSEDGFSPYSDGSATLLNNTLLKKLNAIDELDKKHRKKAKKKEGRKIKEGTGGSPRN